MQITPLNRTQIEKPIKKKQEFKFIGSTLKKRGQFLFGKDQDGNVYPVDLVSKKTFHVSKKAEKGNYKAVIDPNHSFVWALNLKNAKRKLN